MAQELRTVIGNGEINQITSNSLGFFCIITTAQLLSNSQIYEVNGKKYMRKRE